MPFNEWTTPPSFMKLVKEHFGGFIDLDPASNEASQKIVQAENWVGLPNNSLDMSWYGKVFCNPPYSKGDIENFANKAIEEHCITGNTEEIILLVNTAPDTQWQQRLFQTCDLVFYPRGRLKFWKVENGVALPKWQSQTTGKLTNSPRYQNVVFYFGGNGDSFHNVFSPHGSILTKGH